MSTTLKNIVLLLLFIFVCLQNCVLALRREFPTCRSRDTCIRLTNCLPYMNLIKSLKKPLSRASVLFLRKQECGFDGLYPLVCCFPSNTRRSKGNRFKSVDDKVFSTKAPSYYVPTFYHETNNGEEEPQGTYQLFKKPDFTPGDLSDYRSYKVQATKPLTVPVKAGEELNGEFVVETSSLKSTTEKVKATTRSFRRKVNHMFSDNYFINGVTTALPMQLTASEEAKNKKAEEMKKKMNAINQAFMYSTMDYFFVRRMDDQKNRSNDS